MDLQALIHDRRFQVAAAGVAAVGGFVWYQRRKSGGGAAAGTPSAPTAAGYQQGGTLDTSGTDIANWLGQYSGSLQNQLDAYAQSLSDAEAHLGAMPPSGSTTTGTTTPGTGGTVSSPAAPPPAPAAAHQTVKVVAFTSSNPAWNSTLSGIAGHYRTTVSALLRLNPSISNPNLIHPGQTITVS